jgi:hypothetical protein
MECFRVAHLRQNGAELLIVPIDRAFGNLPTAEKRKVILHLQLLAAKSGLAGVVIPVWDSGHGKMGFVAPEPWHAFFNSINMRHVAAGLNCEIWW